MPGIQATRCDRHHALWSPFGAPRGSPSGAVNARGVLPLRVPEPGLSRRHHHITRPHSANTRAPPLPAPKPDARTQVLPARGAGSAAPEQARSREPPERGSPGARLCWPPPLRCPRPGPGRPAAPVPSAAAGRAAPGCTRRGSASAPPPPAARRRLGARGLGVRGSGTRGSSGCSGCPALPPARSPSPGGASLAGVTGSGRAGTAVGWAPGRRAGALLRTRALMRAPRRGLSPWLPRGRAVRTSPPRCRHRPTRAEPSPSTAPPACRPAPPPAGRPPGSSPG